MPIISRHLPCRLTTSLFVKLSLRPSKAFLTHISHHLLLYDRGGGEGITARSPGAFSESSAACPQQPRGHFLSVAGPDKVNELTYSSETAGKMHASR